LVQIAIKIHLGEGPSGEQNTKQFRPMQQQSNKFTIIPASNRIEKVGSPA